MNEELSDFGFRVQNLDEGLQSSVQQIERDMELVDDRVDRRREENEKLTNDLRVAEARIELLEEFSRTQRSVLERLSARMEAMEGNLCRCVKGKEREQVEEIPGRGFLVQPFVV